MANDQFRGVTPKWKRKYIERSLDGRVEEIEYRAEIRGKTK